jgi:hypothetical protein
MAAATRHSLLLGRRRLPGPANMVQNDGNIPGGPSAAADVGLG